MLHCTKKVKWVAPQRPKNNYSISAGEEELIENAYRVITACSGTLACSGKEHEVNFGELTVHLREGNLADGLGARMWAVSRSLAR